MSLAALAIRGTVGPLFVGHGAQKLFGSFGGHGLEGTGGFFESLGLRPGRKHAIAAGVAETAGGALLTLGALTPLAGSLIAGAMTTAIRKVHAPNGPWVTSGGWEYNAVLIGAVAALVDGGPGRPSVDEKLFPGLRGPFWAALAVGSGIAGSYLVTEKLNAADASAPDAAPQAGAGDPASPDGAAQPETTEAGAGA